MQQSSTGVSLSNVVAAIESLYPPATAQSWDQVGLVVGEPEQEVRTVLLALDPTLAVVREAAAMGADLIITHHPLLLHGIHSVAADSSKGATVQALILDDIALYCAHTNADVAPDGVGHALADACGLHDTEPLTISEGHELGRIGTLPQALSLREFAEQLGQALPATASGMRVAGPPEATVSRVALLGGAGDHAFEAVVAAGADVYVTADLRHHPALEAREQARVVEDTPYLIDAGHYASEAVWLPMLQQRLAAALAETGARLRIDISDVCTDPWTFSVPTGSTGAAGEHNPARGEE
ncbi:Nif3-like dinuclear metal center hexameric protein [soil metagenome]